MICPRCSRENPDQAKFCLECGGRLGEPRPAREERKVVSVLFADLVGFTAQAEEMDPEDVRAMLHPYQANVRQELERYGGVVEKFIGDAVMALFGAPVAHEDDPERAVRAALAVQEALRSEGRLHARIAVTTGEALVALEARPETGEGMAAGDVVNTAARLQGAAPVDGILVDEATYRATERAIEYQAHGAVELKGKRRPVQVWQAMAARAASGRELRQAGLAPLVGRAREVEVLADALSRALNEREPQLVTLVGVPGIGKSRIVWELLQRVDAAPELVAWRQGRCLPYSEGVSFWALGEIVKAEAGILDTDSDDEATAKLARAVANVAETPADAAWIEGHLRPLAGLGTSAGLRREHRGEAFTAWRRFLEALADQRPLVLVLEDLHWADDGLLDFIDHLVEWASGVPMLIVGTGRPELLSRRPGWAGGKLNAQTTSVSPLSDADTRQLVAALVTDERIDREVREAVVQRAQGNPLYAEEFARLVDEVGGTHELPESVQGIISARLDGLTRPEKEVLQDAAVVGKLFWGGAIAALRGEDQTEIEDRLHALERKEFVRRERRSSVAGETEYAFRHILVRDVAYGQIPRAARAERHAAAAAWIESLGRPADHAELLAHHYLSAIELAHAMGQPVDALAAPARLALQSAGDRAMALNAFDRAVRYYRVALELTPADQAQRPRLLFDYGKALRVSEEAGADVLAEAEAQLRQLGDLETAAEAAVLQAELAWFGGDGEGTAAHLARAEQLVDDLPPSASKAYVLAGLSRYHMLGNRPAEAVQLGVRARELAEELQLDQIVAHALINIGTSRGQSGFDRAGVADLQAGIELAERINSPEVARGMGNLATVLQNAGDIRQAHELWRAARNRAHELGDAAGERHYRAGMSWILYDEGAWDEALNAQDEFIAETEGRGGHVLEALIRAYRARIRFARDATDGALEDARQSVAAGRRSGRAQLHTAALALASWVALESGHAPEATVLLDELLLGASIDRHTGVELPLAMIGLGRQRQLQDVIERMPPWRMTDVFRLIASGDLDQAGDATHDTGLVAQSALLRQAAALQLAGAGDHAAARRQAKLAADFWRSVNASRYLGQVEEIAGATDL